MSCESWKFFAVIILCNIGLSTLHFFLKILKTKTETKLDDDLDEYIEKILKVLEWIMAAGRR